MAMRTPMLAALVLALLAPVANAAGPTLSVDAGQDVSPVPRRLFGTGVRPNMESGAPVRAFVRETGVTLFRYPDAVDGGYAWDWAAGGVMTRGGRQLVSPLSKLDGLADLARDTKAEVFFTAKIFDSSPEEAARTVAEAKRRGLGGGYWCFGNEPYFKGTPGYLPRDKYVDLVNAFAPAMKAADPAIKLGIAWGGPFIEEQSDKGRDSEVLRGTKKWVDFVDFHFYTGRWEKDRGIDAKRIMAGSLLVKQHTARFREILKREAPETADKIEITYWEWNGPPWPEVGGLQTLANALFAADALGEMARNGVAAAIQYNLQEHACGLIPGWERDDPKGYPSEPWNGRTVRPVAYAMQLWSREMGPTLVRWSVAGVGSYSTKDWHPLVNYQGDVPLMAVHATRGADGKSIQVMVVNREEKAATEAEVAIAGFAPAGKAEVLTLNGPSALSHNDVADRQPAYHSFKDAPDPVVKLTRGEREVPGPTFRHVFPPHSVTVLKLTAR
ncbi:MAG TPA: hypothetical protein VF796_04135 [Humisphaera sp.]